MKKIVPIIFSFFVCLFTIIPITSFADEQTDDIQDRVYDIWNYINNNMQSGADANDQNNKTNQKMDELNQKVEEMDPEKAIKDYFDTIKDDETEDPAAATEEDIDKKYKLPTGGTSKKVLAGPRAMANVADFFLESAVSMIKYADPSSSVYLDQGTNGELSKQLGSYSINLTEISDPNTTLGKLVNPIRIFAYSLVILFFAVSLVEQTIKYEIFTAKGALKVFGRLLVAKIIIDLSVRVCLLIISIIGSLTVKMLGTVKVSLNIFPDISLKKSDVKVIGPILDAIVAAVVSIILMLIIGVVLVCVSIVMIKLVLRSIELALLMVISPAFFACLSTDVTKEYFKKFISIFIQVAAQTLFMAIALAVCSGHFNSPPVTINNLSGLAAGLIRISPNILIVIAMCVMMVKPPKVLTNLIK
jgi:hypothetical protein